MLTIDTNVWVAGILTDEAAHGVSKKFLEWVRTKEPVLHLPTLLMAELAGAIIRRTGDQQLADESWQLLASFSLARFHELDSAAARHAATMAGQLKLRGPDAVHAATAFATNSILITMDRELAERAAPLVTTMTPEKWLSECEP